MIRLRVAAIAAASSLAFGAVAVPVASAANGTGSQFRAYNFPALYTVAVKGATKSGKQFTGTYGIQRFVDSHGKAYAVGTLKGNLAGHHITRYGVKMPANLTNKPSGSSSSSARAAQTGGCQILNLTLGPINLSLLGLNVSLFGGTATNQTPITLNVSGTTGSGDLLGNLLCGVSNLLNSGGNLSALQGDVQQLVAVLNMIVGDLSGTLPAGL
jgi:hypothetical protein